MRNSPQLNTEPTDNFDFIKTLNEDKTYKLLFPPKDVGMAIIEIYEGIKNDFYENQKFTEADLHDAFAKVCRTNDRYPKELYSAHIMDLQEYFLDYDQQSQKYFFKDYAYKFCEHAKNTLKGAFNPTRIQKICTLLTNSLRSKQTDEDLIFWLTDEFNKYEPDLREQIDFLDRQISNALDQLKQRTVIEKGSFINILITTNESLSLSQSHVRELRSAYAETRMIREILNGKNTGNAEIGKLIREVLFFIRYINDRLNSIDKKLDRIQPKIRQLFSSLNKPAFNAKVERFITYLLEKSVIEYVDAQKTIIFPDGIVCPTLRYSTPNFTIISKDKELFPAKPKQRKHYIQNNAEIEGNRKKAITFLKDIDTAQKWQHYILSEINLRNYINLSETFFSIARQTNSSLAVTVLFNTIKQISRMPSMQLETARELYTDNEFKHITLWKMEVRKLQ